MADVTKEIALEVSLKDSTNQGTQTAKQRLRELQKALTEMALAGQDGTEAFREMEIEAGKLKDQIGDTAQRIKNLASDTKNIDTFVASVQGIAAGFQIAQGAVALFGDENEDLQKALLKVQGAMALANGVQQVANLLNKDSILITQGQVAAQKLYALAVGQSTGAMKAFRIALVTTGIGAIVVAIGLAAEAMGLFTSKTKDNTEAQKENKRALDETAGTLEYYERRLKANGATEADLARERLKMLNREKAILDEKLNQDISRYGVKNDQYQNSLRHELELLDIKIKEENKIIEADNKAKAAAKAQKDKEDEANAKRKQEQKAKENEQIAIQAANELKAAQEITDFEKAELDKQEADFKEFFEKYYAESEAQIEYDRKKAEERKQIEKDLAEYKKTVTLDSLNAISELLSAFGKDNKGLAIAALAIEKGAAIANVIVNLQKEMAANAVMAAANPANVATAGAAGAAQLKVLNTMAKIRAGIRIAAITAAGIQAGKSIMSGGEGATAPSGGGTGPTGTGASAAPSIFANPNVTDLSGFGQGQAQGSSPMRAYVVERDITQTGRRVRRLEEFATLS